MFLLPPVDLLIAVPGNDAHLHYIGRWDLSDINAPKAEWPGSAVEIRFKGKQINFILSDSPNYWVEEVDGVPQKRYKNDKAQMQAYVTITDNKPHTIRFVKATEAFVGSGGVTFSYAPGQATLLSDPAPSRRIEIIGDSISCGYGNEGPNEHEHFKPETENADMSYGAIAAREVHADFADIAWSGRKMWPDNTVPAIYDLTIPTDPASTWSFKTPAPQAVVINLATNDFGRGNPDEAGWTNAYSAFIDHLRSHYPAARVYLAVGTMMSDNYPPNQMALTTLRKYLHGILDKRTAAGDQNCAILDFGTQDAAADGLGSDYHPNVKTHQKMAAKLVDALKTDLHW